MKTKLIKGLFFLLVLMLVGCSKEDSPSPTEVIKTKVNLTRIEVPTYPSGTWDLTTYPDFYATFSNEFDQSYGSSTTDWNINPSATYPFFVSFVTPIQITNLSSGILKIRIYDNDTDDSLAGSDDLMGTVNFNIADYTTGSNKYPSSVTKVENGIICKIFLTWE